MRGTVLSVVRSMVKTETAKSLQTTSTSQDAEINQLIYNTQSVLAGLYTWPFLKTRWDSSIPVGLAGRYTTFPTTTNLGTANIGINFEHFSALLFETKWNQVWQPVVYGIDDYPEFNYLDSDRGQVLDPIQRWQFSDEWKFEVWPLPASVATVRFTGQRQLTELRTTPLTNPITWNDAALLDLDDILVSLFTAAEYLKRQKSSAAGDVKSRATERLNVVRAGYPVRTTTCVIGRGSPLGQKAIRLIPLVMVGGK